MARPSNESLPLGFKLGRYTINRKLSSGGFGIVYSAKREDGLSVAIKEFMPASMACRGDIKRGDVRVKDSSDRQRFQDGLEAFFREADMLSKVQDERVISIWDVFKQNGTAYFVMPIERGNTLQAMIRQAPEDLGDGLIREWFIRAAQGLEVLHQNGLLHLDVKPSNLWLRPDGTVVVLDLGTSRWQSEEGRTGQLARTPGFAAPEQHGSVKVKMLTVRTDVYGLAASIYSAIEGTPPPVAPERERQRTSISLLQRRVGQHHPDLLRVVDKGMALNPSERFSSMAEMVMALERVPSSLPRYQSFNDLLGRSFAWTADKLDLP